MQGTNGRGERQGKFSGSVAASSTKKEGAAVQTGSCRAQEGFDDRKKGAASRRRGRLDRCLPSLLGQAEPGSNGGACETLTRNQAALRGGRGPGLRGTNLRVGGMGRMQSRLNAGTASFASAGLVWVRPSPRSWPTGF